MANITNPQEFTIASVDLITSSGQAINLKPSILELSIYESMYSGVVSGHVSLTDSQGFIEIFNITGFNFIKISFSKVGENDPFNDVYFRVHRIGKNIPVSRNNEEFTINFVSEDVFLNQQTRIVKSYNQKTINYIVQDLLTTELNTRRHLLPKSVFEDTEGTYSFIISNKTPFEAIQWLCGYAKPAKAQYGHVGADMLFYDTVNGYNFRSLQSLYTSNSYAEYFYSPQGIYSPGEKEYLEYGLKNMLTLNIKKHFDSLEATQIGLYANKLVTIDPLLQQYQVTEFKYNDYFNTSASLNPYPLTTGYTNRYGKEESQMTNSVFKVMTTNAKQRENPLINNRESLKTIVPSIDIETYIPYRTAQIGLSRSMIVEFTIYGDPNLTIGSKIRLNIPSMSLDDSTGKKANNKYYSGNYLVSAIRHVLNFRGQYLCIVEAVTDSLSERNILTDNSSQNIQNGRLA
jgi:hypothetical protein